ncbi:MAG TPA: GNAT family N-acetyltransferase, partial [Candidatus Tumulicola sp.]|nr:GNAT family N-acetyltransferase [Candidatus Tumulicola sp.]
MPRGLVPDWRERLVACFRTGIEDGSQGWFVAEQSGLLVGSAAALLRASSLAAILHRRPAVLAGVYVLPAFRRQGLARELVLRAIAWSRERGCTHLSLHATAAAEPLYRELGFEDERAMVLN